LSGEEFAALMGPFAPFEPEPALAVAVSGGPDSMALVLLADRWARERGGRGTALTVDHQLRPEAAAEAVQVAQWLGRRGIAHVTLAGAELLPRGDVQAEARALRYRLLEGWCADAGVLHLLTAHHQDDQAETLLLRLARGSGLDGLTGMSAVVERAQCRVLRPLLPVPRARLGATLAAGGQDWIEDPSNRNSAYARVRLRDSAALLAAEGLTGERLAATAGRLGRARAALEAAVAAVLVCAVRLDPAGFAWLDAAALKAAPEEIGLRGLAALLATIAGAAQPPRLNSLERLYRLLPDGIAGGQTLGGCRVLPRRGGVLVCRELSAAAPDVAVMPGAATFWDGRFRLTLPRTAPDGLSLGALGAAAVPEPARSAARFPAAVRPSLPALRDAAGILAVPHLEYQRQGSNLGGVLRALLFCPARPLGRAGFTVV